jgi:hypothetical protein
MRQGSPRFGACEEGAGEKRQRFARDGSANGDSGYEWSAAK